MATPQAAGFSEALSSLLSTGGARNFDPRARGKRQGARFTTGRLRGKTMDEAVEMAKSMWAGASPALRDRYAMRAEGLMSEGERAGYAGPAVGFAPGVGYVDASGRPVQGGGGGGGAARSVDPGFWVSNMPRFAPPPPPRRDIGGGLKEGQRLVSTGGGGYRVVDDWAARDAKVAAGERASKMGKGGKGGVGTDGKVVNPAATAGAGRGEAVKGGGEVAAAGAAPVGGGYGGPVANAVRPVTAENAGSMAAVGNFDHGTGGPADGGAWGGGIKNQDTGIWDRLFQPSPGVGAGNIAQTGRTAEAVRPPPKAGSGFAAPIATPTPAAAVVNPSATAGAGRGVPVRRGGVSPTGIAGRASTGASPSAPVAARDEAAKAANVPKVMPDQVAAQPIAESPSPQAASSPVSGAAAKPARPLAAGEHVGDGAPTDGGKWTLVGNRGGQKLWRREDYDYGGGVTQGAMDEGAARQTMARGYEEMAKRAPRAQVVDEGAMVAAERGRVAREGNAASVARTAEATGVADRAREAAAKEARVQAMIEENRRERERMAGGGGGYAAPVAVVQRRGRGRR